MAIGGQKDERVSCIVHDEINEQIVVVGNSSSNSFVPASNDHGIAYAVDFDGNWKWGRFYYNVTLALQTITGCQIDSAS